FSRRTPVHSVARRGRALQATPGRCPTVTPGIRPARVPAAVRRIGMETVPARGAACASERAEFHRSDVGRLPRCALFAGIYLSGRKTGAFGRLCFGGAAVFLSVEFSPGR